MDGLGKEQKMFEAKRSEWLEAHHNEWVWIHDSTAKFYPSYEDAIRAAYQAGFDKQPIFVKQVTESDEQPTVAGFYNWAV